MIDKNFFPRYICAVWFLGKEMWICIKNLKGIFLIYMDAFDSYDLDFSNNVSIITANCNMEYKSSTDR